MSTLDQARATQLRHIETKTGHDLAALRAAIAASGKRKHSEVRSWLMATYGLGYGDANGLAHFAAASDAADGASAAASASDEDVLAGLYTGKKTHLRAVHDAVLAAITSWGSFEIAPKKGYVALRRKKQFAMLGPKTTDRAELGINLRDADVASARIVAQKPGGMCQYAVALRVPADVDAELLAVLRRAYDAAG